MAMVCILVPPELSKILSKIEVPGEKEPLSEIHITLLYLGEEFPIEKSEEAIKSISSVVSSMEPFSISIDKISSFPIGDDGVPIIIPIESKELQKLHDKLAKSFDKNDIEYSKKWKEFKPHITLSYSRDSFQDKEIPKLSFTVSEICLWGGSKGKEKVNMTFPLKTIANQNYIKLLKYAEQFNMEQYSKLF